MIRTCPRCADFYADSSLGFCPADGTPLADVDPQGDSWTEAARVVEEKGRALRKSARRLRLRRVLTTTTSVLITTLVVIVAIVNTYVYLTPRPSAPVVAAALTPTPTPSRSATPEWTPTPDAPSSLPFVPAVTPTPTIEVTPTPPRKTKDTKRTPVETCTAADRQRLGNEIVAANSAAWRETIQGERAAIIREHVPANTNALRVEVRGGGAELGRVSFNPNVSESCASASVTASYGWTVIWEAFSNGAWRRESKTVGRTKTFSCRKDGGAWRCG